jgi:hypothetical protein
MMNAPSLTRDSRYRDLDGNMFYLDLLIQHLKFHETYKSNLLETQKNIEEMYEDLDLEDMLREYDEISKFFDSHVSQLKSLKSKIDEISRQNDFLRTTMDLNKMAKRQKSFEIERKVLQEYHEIYYLLENLKKNEKFQKFKNSYIPMVKKRDLLQQKFEICQIFLNSYETYVWVFSITKIQEEGETLTVAPVLNPIEWDDPHFVPLPTIDYLSRELLGRKKGEIFTFYDIFKRKMRKIEVLDTSIPGIETLNKLLESKILDTKGQERDESFKRYHEYIAKNRPQYRKVVILPINVSDQRWRDGMREIVITYEKINSEIEQYGEMMVKGN